VTFDRVRAMAKLHRATAALAMTLALGACAESTPPRPPQPSVAAPARADERDLVSLLPATVDSVLTVDLVRMRASAFARPLLVAAAAEDGPGRRARGFDEITDVDTWAFARVGLPGGERGTLELARGRFDRARVSAAFRAARPNARPTQLGTLEGVTDVDLALAFVSPQVMAWGPPWALRMLSKVIAGQLESARGLSWLNEVSAALARGRAPYRDVDADPGAPAAGPAGARAPALELALLATASSRAELAAAFGVEMPLHHVGARIDVGQAARATLIATATSPEAAATLADQIREGLLALRERPSLRALGLGRMLASADVATRDARVGLAMTITSTERARVARNLARFAALIAKKGSAAGALGSEAEAAGQQGAAGQR
jgi:hypothetical protein